GDQCKEDADQKQNLGPGKRGASPDCTWSTAGPIESPDALADARSGLGAIHIPQDLLDLPLIFVGHSIPLAECTSPKQNRMMAPWIPWQKYNAWPRTLQAIVGNVTRAGRSWLNLRYLHHRSRETQPTGHISRHISSVPAD